MASKISPPVYLKGSHYNIPLKGSWNESLEAGLQELTKALKEEKDEIYEIEIERNDDLNEYDVAGSAGYSVKMEKGRNPDDYFYIDILYSHSDDASENEISIELQKTLVQVISKQKASLTEEGKGQRAHNFT
jgi:hypothetical protein